MKKVLLLAIIALSINAFSQNQQPANYKQKTILSAKENVYNRLMDMGLKLPGINSERNSGQSIKYQAPYPLNVIQVMDSIYNWEWSTSVGAWEAKLKYINWFMMAIKM